MLKKFRLNGKTIPVPVPIRNLEEALVWISESLLKSDEVITRVTLDGHEMTDNLSGSVAVDEGSCLEIQADSPAELSVQTLDAVRNLAIVLERSLKPLAVECWQTPAVDSPSDIEAVEEDISLVVELIGNSLELITRERDTDLMRGVSGRLQQISAGLAEARVAADWKSYAKVLLNQLEPTLDDLASEADSLQNTIYASISESAMRQF